MGNWIEDTDENSREYDHRVRAGAERYDREVMCGCGCGCGDDEGEEDDDDDDEDDDD